MPPSLPDLPVAERSCAPDTVSTREEPVVEAGEIGSMQAVANHAELRPAHSYR